MTYRHLRTAATITVALLMSTAAAWQQPETIPASRLAQTLGNSAAMEAWQGRTLRATGFFGGAGSEYVTVNATANGFDHIIDCTINGRDPRVAALQRGQPIVVTGRISRIFFGFTGHFQLTPCDLSGIAPAASPAAPAVAGPAAPADPPLGEYAVYQAPGFQYQYRFALQPGGRYVHTGTDPGKYAYDSRTKTLRFTSGPLEGFVGLYYTRGRNNDKGEPVIALDAEGHVPDLAGAASGRYQYGYFRPGGVR